MASRRITQIAPDPTALKALTHPVRLRMLSLLRLDGPATASGLAARLGLNSGATSYHLRQLALHGFIEEDSDRGNQRDRWWRSRHDMTTFLTDSVEGDTLQAGLAFHQAAISWHMRQMQAAHNAYPDMPSEWRPAFTVSDYTIAMTPEAAAALIDQIKTLLTEAMAAAPPLVAPLPGDLRPFSIILNAAPLTADQPEPDLS